MQIYNSYVWKINKGLEMGFTLKIPRKTIFFSELYTTKMLKKRLHLKIMSLMTSIFMRDI